MKRKLRSFGNDIRLMFENDVRFWISLDKNMRSFFLLLPAILVLITTSSAQLCSETGSYNKTWTLQARAREKTRIERENYYKTLTKEELSRISDSEIYPTSLMTCGMGFSSGWLLSNTAD